MPKTREEWEKIYNDTKYEGNLGNGNIDNNPFANNTREEEKFVKSLELCRVYSGYIGKDGGGFAGKLFSGRWGSKYYEQVQNAIFHYLADDVKTRPLRTPQILLDRISANLTVPPKPGGDLDIIIKLITEKTGARFRKSEERHAPVYGEDLMSDEEAAAAFAKRKAIIKY